jgi:hypothetical protein
LFQEEIKRRLNSGDDCYDSVHNLLHSFLLSINVRIKTHRPIIVPVALYGRETCTLALREVHRLSMFENRVLRIFGPTRDEVTGIWRRLHKEELRTYTLRQVQLE